MKKDIHQSFEEFIQQCRFAQKLSVETIRGYESVFNLFVSTMQGVTFDKLTSKYMTEFFARLEKRERVVGKGKIKKGIKKSTIGTYWSKLNKFFKWLKVNKQIQENPFDDMEYPYIRYEDKKFLRKEQIEKIMVTLLIKKIWANQLIRKRNYALIMIALMCGLRRGELLNLKLYDVNLERRELRVNAETSKSKRQRIIPINPDAMVALEDYLNERGLKDYQTPYLFVSNNRDDKLTKDGLKHLIEKIKDRSGVKFHIHQLRHTFAMNLMNNGTGVAKLQQFMGHRDIRMTSAYLRQIPTKAMVVDVETLSIDRML